MTRTAALAMDAHGGLDRWRRLKTMSARLLQDGVFWTVKGHPSTLHDVHVTVDLRKEWVSHRPFGQPNLHSSFQPDRVAIETDKGDVVEERLKPRESFKGHVFATPWDNLQLAYFAGCAMWTYLNTPFLFATPGVETEELQPWQESGETWRRLKVTFPASIATHSAVQTFYFDQHGLLKRHDYDVEISAGSTAAHYVSELKEFSGIVFPTKRRILPRLPDGKSLPEPLVVSIDLDKIVLF